MIKKKSFLLLSTLLLIVLLGCFGTCYAKTLTSQEIINFIYNGYEYFYDSEPDSTFKNSIENLDFSSWVTASETYEGQWWISYSNVSRVAFGYYYGSATNMNLYCPYIYNNQINANTSYLTRKRSNLLFSDMTISSFTNSTTALNTNDYFFYTDTNLYNSGTIANASIVYNAGYGTIENIFGGGQETSYFEFVLNNDVVSGTAKIYGDTSMTDYYLVPYNAYSVRLGFLYDSNNLDYIVKRKYRYSQANRDFELIKEYVSNVNDFNFYLSGDGYLNVYEYYQPDTTEFIIFTAKDSAFNQIVVPIYYTTRNTNIVGGYINLDNTFSGDYYNNYNNDNNTDKIIDNINNDNEVDSTLNEFISGDAEDIANKFGFRLFNQEYYDFIYNTIVSITNVLTDDSDVYFDYSMHGEAPTRIYASSFTTPNGTLKTFLTMFLVSCTVYAFYKYIADLLELISTGNILEALDEFKVDRNIFKM